MTLLIITCCRCIKVPTLPCASLFSLFVSYQIHGSQPALDHVAARPAGTAPRMELQAFARLFTPAPLQARVLARKKGMR
ncbi:hypothetical protein KC349_g130 [Hortaea werneckii]|nr:hypothetical protein KC349_g130 [Hortaea werneckii]